MNESEDHARARRLEAQLELAGELHGLIVHELGNPLQSLAVLVELTHDDMLEADFDPASGAARLAKALSAIDRLRHLLRDIGRVRACLDSSASEATTWGGLLDGVLPFVEDRLVPLNASLARATGEIDGTELGARSLPDAIVSLLLGLCDQIRRERVKAARIELHGERTRDRIRLRVRVDSSAGPVRIRDQIHERARNLLVGRFVASPSCEREDEALVIWA